DVIASVAGWERVGPFLENTPDFWDRVIAINYLAPVRIPHRFLPIMIERGKGGRIITVASDAGRGGSMGETFYAGSKGASIAFTMSIAREMVPHFITCNCLAPGVTYTPQRQESPIHHFSTTAFRIPSLLRRLLGQYRCVDWQSRPN